MKKNLIASAIFGILLVPALASAETGTTTQATSTQATSTPVVQGTTTPNAIFATCYKAASSKRDATMSTAQSAYNAAMTQAKKARTDAMTAAALLTDAEAQKTAKKKAASDYQTAVRAAQKALKDTRNQANETFGNEIKACNTAKKAALNAQALLRKAENDARKKAHENEIRAKKAQLEEKKKEHQEEVKNKKEELEKKKEERKEQKRNATGTNSSSTHQ